jgi:acylglycerol lipase
MTEPGPAVETQVASDGYRIHVAVWPVAEGTTIRGRVVVLHGIQSHAGWYSRLGRFLAGSGYEVHFPDRRGSGANRTDRGHAPSAHRLLDDQAEYLQALRARDPATPIALAGISWGGKLAVLTAGRNPEWVDALALICPGLHPGVGVPLSEKLRIAWAWLTDRRKTFPIPLNDPALFTASPEGQAFIAGDRLALHAGTAGLLAASTVLDAMVSRITRKVRQPALLMLAGQDRIINNDRTLAYFNSLASTRRQVIEYPDAHHTLEFEPDPSRYARDLAGWLDRQFAASAPGAARISS